MERTLFFLSLSRLFLSLFFLSLNDFTIYIFYSLESFLRCFFFVCLKREGKRTKKSVSAAEKFNCKYPVIILYVIRLSNQSRIHRSGCLNGGLREGNAVSGPALPVTLVVRPPLTDNFLTQSSFPFCVFFFGGFSCVSKRKQQK